MICSPKPKKLRGSGCRIEGLGLPSTLNPTVDDTNPALPKIRNMP